MTKKMTKKDENKMIGIIEREIKEFVKNWKQKPYLWESEADVHAELYKRIKSSINKYKKFRPRKFKCTYEENGKRKEMPKKEWFGWIYLKPHTYTKINGTKSSYYPDIVIYKDTGEKHHVKEKENSPMLWVCEIKYSTEWSSDLTVASIRKDVKKLQDLLKQKADGTGINHTCFLILVRWLKKYEKNKIPKKENLIKIDKYLKGLKGKKIKLYYGKKVINNNGKETYSLLIQN